MIEHKKGILVIVSGFSGAGKGTVVHAMMDKFPGRYKLSVSATTREPRSGEKDGVNYFFVTREKFEKMIADGELLEYAEYVGNYYGTPRRFVEEQMDERGALGVLTAGQTRDQGDDRRVREQRAGALQSGDHPTVGAAGEDIQALRLPDHQTLFM